MIWNKPMETKPCSNCGKDAERTRGNYHLDREVGFPVEVRNIDLIKCKFCGNVDPVIPGEPNDLRDAIVLRLIARKLRLDGKQVRFLRKKYVRKSEEEFARLLNISPVDLSNIEDGGVKITIEENRLVKYLLIYV